MLSRANRIRKKKDFESIFKKSKSLRNNLFVFKIAQNDLGVNRFGFVVSKKIDKKAVVRNKIKRRLAEVVRPYEKRIKKGTDLIIIGSPEIKKVEFLSIKKAIDEALSKARLIEK